jgi:phospholipid/cholesterol/gamma-HCH transport system permease protein
VGDKFWKTFMTDQPEQSPSEPPTATFEAVGDGSASLTVSGSWRLARALPAVDGFEAELAACTGLSKLELIGVRLGSWDSSLAAYLTGVISRCRARNIDVDINGLPADVQGLLNLAFAVPEREGARKTDRTVGFLERFGNDIIDLAESTGQILGFIGEVMIAFRAFLRGKANYTRQIPNFGFSIPDNLEIFCQQ